MFRSARSATALGLALTLWAALGLSGFADADGQPRTRQLASQDRVNCVAFTADGKVLASGSHDRVIRLWDMATGKEIKQITGHKSAVWALRFSPDGKLLASGGADCRVGIWEAGGKHLFDLRADANEPFRSLAFSPDSQLLATGNNDGTVRVWNLKTANLLYATRLGRESKVAFSPDGAVLAASSSDGLLHLWKARTGDELRPIGRHERQVNVLAFSPDGRMLASGGSDRLLRVWEVATGQARWQFKGHEGSILDVAFVPGGRLLASASTDKTVRFWDLHTGKQHRQFTEEDDFPRAIAFAPAARLWATASVDRAVTWEGIELRAEPLKPLDKLDAQRLNDLWLRLADRDAEVAYRGVLALGAAPEQAVPLLRGELKTQEPADAERIERLVVDLDSTVFKVRQKATEELEKLGDAAAPALKRARAANPSLEVARRIDDLLGRLEKPVAPPEILRIGRALEALEISGHAEARKLIEKLAAGRAGDTLTDEARHVWQRLQQHKE